MLEDASRLEKKWLEAVAAASGLDALETVRVEALGKKGEISGLMKAVRHGLNDWIFEVADIRWS